MGATTGAARTGDGIRNALFRPTPCGLPHPSPPLREVSVLAAQAAKVPDAQNSAKGYGTEIDLRLQYDPYEHFQLKGTLGTFFPGKYYSTYKNDDLGGGFDTMALGGMLMAAVQF